MSQHMFGWSYPPGVTDADIDRHFGESDEPVPQCPRCSVDLEGDEWHDTCPSCREEYLTNDRQLCWHIGANNTTEESMSRAVYKNTDCGGWLAYTDGGIRLGTIVEGSDAEWERELDYPLTRSDYDEAIEDMEAWAAAAWDVANGAG